MNRSLRRALLAGLGPAALLIGGCAELDDRPASWTYVHATIIEPNCATSGCHSSLTSKAGLNLEEREAAYLFLTGRVCDGAEPPGEPVRNFVTPGDPSTSQLIYMVTGQTAIPMPPDTPLPEANVELLRRWILEEAPCD